MKRALWLAGVAAATIGMIPAGAVLAQETPVADSTPADVGGITVTAQRREESANAVGMPIQAFSGETLEQLQVRTVQDLSSVAPSFSVSQSYQGVPIYTLRGIGFNTINLSATSTVGSYVDEVAYAYPFMLTGPVFDLQRVEVLKGPQGTLYGRNTTAGLIDFITNRPTREFDASLTAEVGNFETINVGGFVSGPLGDRVQARLAFRVDNSGEGWQRSNTRDERQGEIHRSGVRLWVTTQPTDQTDVDLTVSGWWNTSDTIVAQGIGFTPNTDPVTGGFGPFNALGLPAYIAANFPTSATEADWAPEAVRSANIGTGLGMAGPLREDNSFQAVALRITHRFSEDLRLVSLTGYNHLERDALFDWSGAPYEILLQQAEGEITSWSEELRLEGSSDRLNWLIGGYWADDSIQDNNRTMLGQNANVAAIRFNGNLLLPTPFNSNGYTALEMSQAFRTYRDIGDLESSTWSLFGNASWRFAETLTLNLGLRYTQDEQSYTGCSADFNGNMLPNVNVVNRFLVTTLFAAPTPAPIVANACVTYDPAVNQFRQLSHSLEEDNVAWRVALDWQATPTILLYASLSEGAKAGNTPINAANISTQQLPARQERLLAYEAGIKAGLFERRLQANVSVFYYDYRDKQLSVYFADPIYTALARLANVPDSHAYGVDAEVTFRPIRALTFVGAATWLETSINNYQGINAAGQPQLYDDRRFPYSPRWQVSGTVILDQPITDDLGLQAAITARHQSNSASDLGDDPDFAIDSYSLVNGSVGIHSLDGRWQVSLWAQNLTDTYYWTSVSSNANVVVRFPGRPRTYGASLTYNW